MNHKIARLAVHGAKKDEAVSRDTLTRFVEKFVEEEFNKRHYEFVLTYGRFLMFEFPAIFYSLSDSETTGFLSGASSCCS